VKLKKWLILDSERTQRHFNRERTCMEGAGTGNKSVQVVVRTQRSREDTCEEYIVWKHRTFRTLTYTLKIRYHIDGGHTMTPNI
jgi:hypothetical protein